MGSALFGGGRAVGAFHALPTIHVGARAAHGHLGRALSLESVQDVHATGARKVKRAAGVAHFAVFFVNNTITAIVRVFAVAGATFGIAVFRDVARLAEVAPFVAVDHSVATEKVDAVGAAAAIVGVAVAGAVVALLGALEYAVAAVGGRRPDHAAVGSKDRMADAAAAVPTGLGQANVRASVAVERVAVVAGFAPCDETVTADGCAPSARNRTAVAGLDCTIVRAAVARLDVAIIAGLGAGLTTVPAAVTAVSLTRATSATTDPVLSVGSG